MEGAKSMSAEQALIEIDRVRCVGCFECIDVCPQVADLEFPVFEPGRDGFPKVVNEGSCIRCLSCEYACRAEAIRVGGGSRADRPGRLEAGAERKCRSTF